MNEKLLIAPTVIEVAMPVVLDLRGAPATVKANLIDTESVSIAILIGETLKPYASLSEGRPFVTLPAGETYAVTKSATRNMVGVFVSSASHAQAGGDNAVLWGDVP